MFFIDKLAGFPIDRSHRFDVNGTRYRVGNAGVNAVELAVEILHLRMSGQSILPLRQRVRELKHTECKAVLSHLIEKATNPNLALIAIWLRGLCGGYIGSNVVAKYAGHEIEGTRYVAAKAMKRMGVWSTLNRMALNDPSERIRRVAVSRSPVAFQNRFSNFSKNVESISHVSMPSDLYWSPSIELQRPIRLKSVELIRQILLRIRRLVTN